MVYFIVLVNIKSVENRKEYDDYIIKVKPIIEKYGGKYIVRSENITALCDKLQKPDRIIIIQWEDKKQLLNCFNSKEYIMIKNKRENSVESKAFIVEA